MKMENFLKNIKNLNSQENNKKVGKQMKFSEWIKNTDSINYNKDNEINYINEETQTLDFIGGIDKFDVGFMCNITLGDRYSNNSITVPALIVNKYKIGEDEWPVYDVYFWTKTNTNTFSGAILLSQICLWRYVSDLEIDVDLIKAAIKGEFDNLISYSKKEYKYSYMKNNKLIKL